VVLAGRILGLAAVLDGKNVVQTQSYGAEARGSAAKSELIISDDRIGYPAVRRCDVLIALSQAAVDRHAQDLSRRATLLVDANLQPPTRDPTVQIHQLPANKTAETRLKSRMYANLIMLGALVRLTKIVSRNALEEAIKSIVRADTAQANLKAFDLGYSLRPLTKRR
jgi:2-oxoglutarate ferredoxin oxidoreductase subunit gamma